MIFFANMNNSSFPFKDQSLEKHIVEQHDGSERDIDRQKQCVLDKRYRKTNDFQTNGAKYGLSARSDLPGCIQEGKSPPAAVVIPQADLQGKTFFRSVRGSFFFCVVGKIDQAELQIRIAWMDAGFSSAVVENTDLKTVCFQRPVEDADLRDAIVLFAVQAAPEFTPVYDAELNAVPVCTEIDESGSQPVEFAGHG